MAAEVLRVLSERGAEAHGLRRPELDITDETAVHEAIAEHKPTHVFNCAAYNQVDKAEEEFAEAMAVNGFAVRHMARACGEAGATLVHYSTDHVFAGDATAPYREEDVPAPPSAYGVSKLAGEGYAAVYCSAYVIRVAGVFGPAGRATRLGNFPEVMLRKAAEGAHLRVVDDFSTTPTYAPALADRTLELVERAPAGLYHLGGGTDTNWYDYAARLFRLAGVEARLDRANKDTFPTPAKRPHFAALSNAKAEDCGVPPFPPLDEAVRDWLDKREAYA